MNNYSKNELINILESYSLSATQANSVGNAFRHLDEFQLAEKYFLLSIELDPKYDEPYAHLISLYAQQGKFDLCESIFQQGNKNATKKTYNTF